MNWLFIKIKDHTTYIKRMCMNTDEKSVGNLPKYSWEEHVRNKFPQIPRHRMSEKVVMSCKWEVLAQKNNGEIYSDNFTLFREQFLSENLMEGYSSLLYNLYSAGGMQEFFDWVGGTNKKLRHEGFNKQNSSGADLRLVSFQVDGVDVFDEPISQGIEGLYIVSDILAMLDGKAPWYKRVGYFY